MQRREEPGFHFGTVAQLMTLGGPQIKRLLRQIAGVCLGPGEAEGKLVKRL